MVSSRAGHISTRTLTALIASIAVVDIVANVVTPDTAKLPLKVGIVVAYLIWARRSAGLTWQELGLGKSELAAGVRWGLLAAAIVGAVILLLVATSSGRSHFEDSGVADDSTAMRVLEPLVIIPIGTVLFEEVIFRGVLLGALLRTTTRRIAIIASAVIFGLWHLPPALGDASGHSFAGAIGIVVGTIAATTAAGVAFAWLRVRSGSLLAPALAHVASNSFAYVASVATLN